MRVYYMFAGCMYVHDRRIESAGAARSAADKGREADRWRGNRHRKTSKDAMKAGWQMQARANRESSKSVRGSSAQAPRDMLAEEENSM